jgi:ribosomal protein L37AE/L43A
VSNINKDLIMSYIYKHTRKDTNEVFYIGIGKALNRIQSKLSRNPMWHNIVNKTEYVAEMIEDGLTWEEACIKEKELISFYGRRDLGIGTLVNMTDGGDGMNNPNQQIRLRMAVNKGQKIHTEESKRKIGEATRIRMLGSKSSEETKQRLSDSHKGILQSDETKKKRSLSMLGKNTGPKSEEIKRKIGEANKNKIREQLTCPFCGKTGAINGMKQWHFDNCKLKINLEN